MEYQLLPRVSRPVVEVEGPSGTSFVYRVIGKTDKNSTEDSSGWGTKMNIE